MAVPDTRSMMVRSVSEADAAMQRALLQAARDAEKLINDQVSNISGEVSQAQILRILEELRELAHQLWGEMIPEDLARVIAMAERRSRMGSDALDELMIRKAGGNAKEVKRLQSSMRQRAKRVVQIFQTRERMARFELSPRVYKWEAWHNGRVDQILAKQFALGASARDIARAVREFIDPNTRGGASYAAKRLARTEVANAFHEQTRRDYADNPFVTGLKWNLSRSHPHKDPCDLLATGHSKGLSKGVYRKDEVPDKPHPQCLCNISPETVSEDKFRGEFFAGEYNDFLMNKYDDIDPEDLPPYEKAPKKTPTPARPKKTAPPTKPVSKPTVKKARKKRVSDVPMNERKGKGEVAKIRSGNRTSVKKEWDGLDQQQKDRVKKAIIDHSKADVHVRVSENSLKSILNDKRFKTAYEVSKDADYMKVRKDYEDSIMGLGDKSDKDRPIYGYAGDINSASGYGDFAVTFKDSVRRRATMSAGDSLNGMLDVRRPDEIPDLSDEELLGMLDWREIKALGAEGEFLSYMEVQVGNLGVEDIESITVPSDTSDDLIERIRKSGIKVIVEKSEEDLLMEELMRKMGK